MVLAVLAVAIPAQLYLAIPVAPAVQRGFGVDAGAAAWTGSAFSFAYALGFLVFGPLSDRAGRRPVLVLGTLATAATTAATALSTDFGWFLAFRALQGFAAATFAPVALAHVAERAPAARRPLLLSLLTTGLLGAGVAGQLLGQLAGEHGSWRAAFWPAAIGYALAAAALHRLLPAPRRDPGASVRGVLTTFGRLFRRRETLAVFAAALTVLSGFVALHAVLNRHLRESAGFGTGELLGVQALAAAGLIAAPVAGRFAGGRGPRALAVSGFLTALAGLLLAQLTAVPPPLVLAGVVHMAGIGLVVPALVGLLHRLAPGAGGAAVAVNTFALFLGASLGQLLAAHTGHRPLLAGLALATALAALAVRSAGRETENIPLAENTPPAENTRTARDTRAARTRP
ncbi:MFS transporter [Streptomyces sp. CAU 1734]|uniref:MFS transporter n=1 Tax=Streptomyces sp. CAU 1734 TaxID=3140360 RepID=UPI0032605501